MNSGGATKTLFRFAGVILCAIFLSCAQGENSLPPSGGGGFPVGSPNSYSVSVTLSGQGTGNVTSSPPGINCGNICSFIFTGGISVALTASPSGGSAFAGWSGDCTGLGACALSPPSNKRVTAHFNVSPISLNVMAIDGGRNHTCALKSDGTVKCWGLNSSGQLGDGNYTDNLTPVAVYGLTSSASSTATAVSAGGNHTCVVMSDGTVKCWGLNSFGQLGNGSLSFSLNQPVSVTGLTRAIAVSGGGDHTCALVSDGTVQCWGLNSSGQLGNGTYINKSVPVPVYGLTSSTSSTATAVSAGANHTCMVMSDGTVKCWGSNSSGQLGNNSSSTNSNQPVSVSGLTQVIAVSAGANHTCAVMSDGTVKCWGSNSSGQIGNGPVGVYNSPVSVTGISQAAAVSAGANHTCALIFDGSIQCWGDNSFFQLGTGTIGFSLSPIPVNGMTSSVVIGTGDNHTCTILSDGTVECWGDNLHGQLGTGNNQNSYIPQPVSGL